ncbi:hypothetical protein IGI04_020186 [Brassica rapa subsp. trilocularis]|uniref:F-box domain-containing protein n=1 Tax=Brassica rapa subsp. trilocularis TaxID=1813537 RepID=A0ABQ7MI03_BRACM|nr:hypothetical protein IGI04_020186 [Brassica rapa subsp. trilocularis]
MSQGKMADDRRIKAAVDLISNLPDEILQHILCFIRIELAITTSLLSRRWKHVWCEIPSLSLDATILTAASVNKTLSHYTAPKTKSFHLKTYRSKYTPHINRWIKFAMSHNVENLSLDFWANSYPYKLPDFFYNSSSFRQLNINELKVLDLRKSLRLRTLQIRRNMSVPGPTQIVAPHIHSLRLLNSQLSCTFVDVSSLTEAKLDICYVSVNPNLKADFLQTMVLKMLEKLQNVEKLTFGGNFIQILSLAEIRGVSFPMLKVKTLTLDTDICQYVIRGIERLLQNSPDLDTLTALSRDFNSMPGKYLDQYLKSQGFNLNTCWRSTSLNNRGVDLTSEHVASFVELMLKHTKKLDKMLVLLDERFLQFEIEDVVVPTFSHNKNVNVVLCATKLMASEECRLKVLDLSKSLRLRTLEVNRNLKTRGPRQIVAPHVHCLRLVDSLTSCTLVDVGSLTEGKLDICYVQTNNPFFEFTKPDFLQLQVKVLEMLEKVQNAEKLTFGGNFIEILSLAEIRGVYFPMLKKLTVRGRTSSKAIPEHHLDQYLKSQSLKPDQCWKSSKDGFNWNTSCCCCVLSALLLSCADGASSDSDLAYSGNTPDAGGAGCAGCSGGCGD